MAGIASRVNTLKEALGRRKKVNPAGFSDFNRPGVEKGSITPSARGTRSKRRRGRAARTALTTDDLRVR